MMRFGAFNESNPKRPISADIAVVLFRIHLYDLAVLAARDHAASRPAGRADGGVLLEVPLPAVLPAVALHDRVHRAGVHTGPAEGAARILERFVHRRRYLGGDAAAHEVEHVRVLLLADPHAPAAKDAVVVVDGDEGAPVVQRIVEALPAE